MKHLLIAVAITGVFFAVRASSAQDTDEQELIQLQHEWCRAELERDSGALGRMLADEYSLVTVGGTVITKAQMLAKEEFLVTSMTVENVKVQVYGNAAVVKGIAKWLEPSGKSTEALFTETWIRRDGRWQCVATHESEMGEKSGEKVRNADANIEGMWDLQEEEIGGELIDCEKIRALKAIKNGTFLCTYYERETGKTTVALGGTYSFDGKAMTETVKFVSRDNAEIGQLLGQTLEFRITCEEGRLYQSGEIQGMPFRQVWARVK